MNKFQAVVTTLAGVVAFATVSVVSMPEASACGGFFCNRNSPVNQADENIVFTANDDGTVTALIQIMYQGPSEDFAWMLPVPGEPEVGVSSATVFQRLTSATNPSYNIDRTIKGECADRRAAAGGTGGGGARDASAAPPSSDAAADSPVDVVDQGSVGPYNYTTISVDADASDPAEKALDWLENNNYDLTDIGPDLLGDYLADNMNIVAFKLQKNSESGDIRPVKLTYQHPLPMIPLKLTAVAAQEDMGVRVWVGGDHRAVPTRFLGMKINPAAINWFRAGSRYDRLVTEAADESGGRAFATEFAGDAEIAEDAVFGPGQEDRWDQFNQPDQWTDRQGELLFRTIRNYGRWDGMVRVIRQEVPLPDGVTAQEFANRPFNYIDEDQETIEGFDPAAYLEALDTNVIEPVRSAEELLQSQPYLTRLYTTVSPDEMTEDPTFAFNRDLPDVDQQRTAELTMYCSSDVTRFEAPWEMELPDGTVVHGRGRSWPFDPTGQAGTDISAVKEVRDFGMNGPPEVVQDESDAVREVVDSHNESFGDPSEDDLAGGMGTAGSGSDGTKPSEAEGGGANWGCGCSSRRADTALGDLLLGLIGFLCLAGLRRRD